MLKELCATTIIMIAACGSSAPPTPPNCEAAVRTAAKLFGGTADQPTDAQVAQLVARCIEEKWTDTVRVCVASAGTPERMVSCISGREASPGDFAGKRSEAELNLDAIKKSAKTYFVEKGEYPRVSVDLTPTASCCSHANRKCPASPSDWIGVPAWDTLDFEISEDHFYQYSFSGDGTSYEARAVGDLDCDGTSVTYVLRGRLDSGRPVSELLKPSNAD